MKKKIIILLCLSFIVQSDLLSTEWVAVKLADIDKIIVPFTIGDGRNDGKKRLYALIYGTRQIYEFTWEGSFWKRDLFFDGASETDWPAELDNVGFMPNCAVQSIVIGDGRNDGINRVYVAYNPLYYLAANSKIAEFTWNKDKNQWEMTSVLQSTVSYQQTRAIYILVMGDIRGDGKNRIYAAGYQVYSYDAIWEYTYDSDKNVWVVTPINIGIVYKFTDLKISDARNDGRNRLYAVECPSTSDDFPPFQSSSLIMKTSKAGRATRATLHEISYDETSSTFVAKVIYQSNYEIGKIAIGDGRNEGQNSIYLIGGWWVYESIDDPPKIIELKFINGTWKEFIVDDSAVIDQKEPHYVAGVAPLRNDGINRLYVDYYSWRYYTYELRNMENYLAEETEGFYVEYTWNGTKWEKRKIESPYFISFLTGDGRNNRKIALYSVPGYEVQFAVPQQPYDRSKTQQDKLQLVNNYFKRGSGWTTVWYYVDTAGDVSLDVYTIDGRLVKRLFSGYRERGEYNEVWTGRDDNGGVVSTGVYLIRLKAPGTDVIKKVCVVR